MSQRRLEEQLEATILTAALVIVLLPFVLVLWLWKTITRHDY